MFERRYSLAKFSVNLETKTIEIAETFSEALNSVAGVAIPVDVRERYADAVQGYTHGDHGRHISDGGGRAYASHHSARGRAPAR